MHDPRGAGRIRLLIVDDVPATAQNIEKLLYFEKDIQVIGTAHNAREAIAKANQLRPDVILMDINMPDMDGLRTTQVVLSQVATRVIIMSVQGEQEYRDQAMIAGARAYVVKPFSAEELISKIRAVAGSPLPPGVGGQQGHVPPQQPAAPPAAKARLHRMIAVFSPKGGVGRSVIACNLAVALKKLTDARVCLVDADLESGDAHVLLNLNAPNTIDDLREAAGGLEADVINSAVAMHDSGVELLRAPVAVESKELFTADAMKAIMVELRDHFDYLVIDTDSSFADTTLTVLDMADQILLVTTLEVTTINKVTRFFEVINRLGYAEDKVKLICNRVEAYFGIKPPQVEQQVRHRFASQIPEDNRLVVNSVNRGVPFVLTDRRAPVSRSIQSLAERVAESSMATPDVERGPKSNRRPFGR